MPKIEAKLTRTWFSDKRTLGVLELFAEGELAFSCYTCEDAVRGNGDPARVKEWKVQGQSAIPYGTYTCKFTHSQKYKRNMWELQNVPGFQGIRIHSGNTEDDSEGCILLGERIDSNYGGILDSKKAVDKFEAMLAKSGNGQFQISITGQGEA
ncbi:MAG: DUF5675 family protein [Fibromonadaceae bacterium]|nr:DUF5675 family protein [Fibromonadaceae bacterium]